MGESTPTPLWPENLDEDGAPEDTPKLILEQAGRELGDRTAGKVVGELQTRSTGDKLEHSFYLRSTEVDYRYFMFKVRHVITGFPVEIIFSSDAPFMQCSNQEAFEAELRRLFSDTQTRQIVNRLRNLAREVG
ncbi:hypothetical protein DB30_07871 [Enhygromyxa salina]|uniref:Uncharacterized protein n=1 Tax=Enhygromyxa salina TaxID=215803 RepID=A0A0C1ZRN4_9BACT|nr:hypothetical protein [Enhygromyxa salina]KIG13663.1 hypothetical protein DB30_07871 [Enhygromyxa salina]